MQAGSPAGRTQAPFLCAAAAAAAVATYKPDTSDKSASARAFKNLKISCSKDKSGNTWANGFFLCTKN
jgi:hypothetical protein